MALQGENLTAGGRCGITHNKNGLSSILHADCRFWYFPLSAIYVELKVSIYEEGTADD